MPSMAALDAAAGQQGHRRNRSAVLKSIIAPKSHRRSPSDGTALTKSQPDGHPYNAAALQPSTPSTPLLPPDHPHSQPREPKTSPAKGLHKKTKSSTNLAAMFGKSRQIRDGKAAPGKDKENTTPPSSSNAPAPVHTPIWAEFSSQPFQEVTTTSKVPLNDRRSIEEEILLYTPSDYSPSKQRNFFDYGQPSLQKRPAANQRPTSMVTPNSSSAASLLDTLARKRSNDRVPLSDTKGNGRGAKDGASSRATNTRGMLRRSSSDSSKRKVEAAKKLTPSPKKPSRVMAAVAAFNGRAKDAQATASPLPKLDPGAVEAEFEAVLESRNIPQHQRAAMRTLKLEVKADFVRTHKLETPTVSRATSAHSSIGETPGKKSTKSTLSRGLKSRDGPDEAGKMPLETDPTGGSSKRERPRSRTFTFSKGDSPMKKQRAERPPNERKASAKSNPIPKSPSMRSLISNGSTKSSKSGKVTTPDEFVTYMKKTPKPQDVEVGRLQKLRQLLRNETVDWVDGFVQEHGLTELAGLLSRIMEVEWREDHEDQLLHEVLRCLKGLCTTDSALKQLADMAPTLFPALLGMLFDEEHKGPSEFTTRELIIQIVFAHISTAPETELHTRAAELLKYLKDPVKEKEAATVPFVLRMHQPRPYQVWCKEITNVTKEVFWIFIHHLNVIPLPQQSSKEALKSYAKEHFPGPRAIVPAAPYVGGVEWDATNYIATHLDLLNGLIASLPTRELRNSLRSEFKVSGFEKLMGHLRACNPKYYGAVHDAVKVWIAAALDDEWDVKPVRMGPSDPKPPSPVKSSPQKKIEKAPKIEAPKMDAGLGLGLDIGFEKPVGALNRSDDWI